MRKKRKKRIHNSERNAKMHSSINSGMCPGTNFGTGTAVPVFVPLQICPGTKILTWYRYKSWHLYRCTVVVPVSCEISYRSQNAYRYHMNICPGTMCNSIPGRPKCDGTGTHFCPGTIFLCMYRYTFVPGHSSPGTQYQYFCIGTNL